MARRLKGAASARQRQLARAHDDPGAETIERAAQRLGLCPDRTWRAFIDKRVDVVERRRDGTLRLHVPRLVEAELKHDE